MKSGERKQVSIKKIIYSLNDMGKKKILDTIYLLIMGMYLIRQFFDTTMFHLDWPGWYLSGVRAAIILYMVLKILNKGYKNVWEVFIDSGVMACMIMIYLSTGYGFFIDIGFLIIEARRVPYKKILMTCFAIGVFIMAVTILGALTGCIEDLIYADGKRLKHAMGIVYTTDFGAHIFFLLSVYLVIREKTPGIILNIIFVVVSYLLYRISGTRCSSGCILLLVIGGIYVKYTNRVLTDPLRESKWNKMKLRIIQLFDSCIALMAPFCAFVMFFLTINHSQEDFILGRLNNLFSGRLRFGKEAIETYGINLWGTAFNMIGAGGGDIVNPGYNFIDSSYIMILVRYGFVLFVITLIGFVWLSFRAIKYGKRMLLLTLSIIMVQCTLEHHLLEIAYNSFFLLFFSEIVKNENLLVESQKVEKRYRVMKYCAVIIFSAVLWKIHQYLLSLGKTFVIYFNLNEPNRNIYFIIIFLFIMIIVLTAYIIWRRYISMLISRNR